MNSINSNFSTSFFRHVADAFAAPRGKTVAGTGATGNELRNTVSSHPVRIRDEFTLSHQGQAAYEKHIHKGDKTESNVPPAKTQVDENTETQTSATLESAPTRDSNDLSLTRN